MRGGFVAVYVATLLHGDGFPEASLAAIGGWLRIRATNELIQGPVGAKEAERLGLTVGILAELEALHLVEVVKLPEQLRLWTYSAVGMPKPTIYPSDTPEAIRERVAAFRARKRERTKEREANPIQSNPSVTVTCNDVTTLPLVTDDDGPDVTELHPTTRKSRKRAPAAAEPDPPTMAEPAAGDPFDGVYGRFPKPTTRAWHDRLVKSYPGRVDAAMRQAISSDPDPGTLLSRTEAILKADKAADIDSDTSARIAAEVASRRAKREALAARIDAEGPFVVPPWSEVVAPKQAGPVDRSAELKAKCSARRQADKKAPREPQPSPLIGALL